MCRLAAAVGIDNAAEIVRRMLLDQQHGGQEGAGIATEHDGQILVHKDFGLVDEVFGGMNLQAMLPGRSAIGHVRYATTGESRRRDNLHPLTGQTRHGSLAVAHNGNLTNYQELKQQLMQNGCVLRSDSDTELILSLLGHSTAYTAELRLMEMFAHAQGAATLLVMEPGKVYLGIDPHRFRPLAYARYQGGFLVASETRALRLFGLRDWRVVEAGQIVTLMADGTSVIRSYAPRRPERNCVFEKVYFAMPDSEIFGDHVGRQRRRMGAALGGNERLRHLDVIIPVPDSAIVAAEAVAKESGMPLMHGLVRNKYTGRTFITPTQVARELGVRTKLRVDESVVQGKHVGVVDDSIVRGTTTKQIAQLLREAGALSVHLLVSSPPVIHPCHWGIDTPHRQDLIAARVPVDQLANELGVDSVTYLTVGELLNAVEDHLGKRHCTYCFSGKKPVAEHPVPSEKKDD